MMIYSSPTNDSATQKMVVDYAEMAIEFGQTPFWLAHETNLKLWGPLWALVTLAPLMGVMNLWILI